MRLLSIAAITLSLGVWLALASADDKSDRAAKFAEAKKKFEATFKELQERFANAEPADKGGIQAEMREETLLMAGKVLAIAEGEPKDEVGFDAAAYIVQRAGMLRATSPDVDKALAIIAEHHAKNAKVKEFLIPAISMGAGGEKLLAAVAEQAEDKETKATAMFIRGYMIAQKIDDGADEAKLNEQVKQATELMEQAAKLAPGAKLGTNPKSPTIGDIAAKEINSLKAVLSLGVGKVAPELTSKLLDGSAVKLSDYKGKVVLLDIWATWCGPCRAMIPHEREMVEKLKDRPFVLISVSADDKKETLEKFLETEKMPWVHWWNDGPRSEVLSKYRVKAFPTLYVIDHAGVIRHKWVGNPGNDKIDAAIEELVKAAEKAKS